MAAITNAATGLTLPAGYTANVVAGTPLPGPTWTTLGVDDDPASCAPGFPRIVALRPAVHRAFRCRRACPATRTTAWSCSSTAQDPFTSTQRNVDLLTLADRKVGQKNLHIVEFIGTPPPPRSGVGMWIMMMLR